MSEVLSKDLLSVSGCFEGAIFSDGSECLFWPKMSQEQVNIIMLVQCNHVPETMFLSDCSLPLNEVCLR